MKKFLSLILAALMIAAAAALAVPASAASPFDDVKDTRWSYSSIVYAVNAGYMKGTGERIFSPSGTLTRAMVATVLWRRQGSPAPTAPSGFSDVPEGKWYSDAVAWAKETGIVQGVSETKFKPEANVTREQLATMLFRFSETAPVCVPERADLGVFPDGSSVHDWAREAMGWAVEAALVKGSSDGSLDPSGFATREQFAAIIERFDNTFKLEYRTPVVRSHYTEPEYPLVSDADFYVSTDGDDSADGSFEHPFRTWERARDAVRALDKTGRDGITVAFMAGDYGALSLDLAAEDGGTPDCPVTYCKYGDGDVVFDDGFTVSADEFVPLDESDRSHFSEKHADRIMKADISDRLAVYNPKNVMVLGDEGTLSIARFPNIYSDGSDNLMRFGVTVDDNHIEVYSSLFNNRIAKYHTVDGLILYGYITLGWYKDMMATDGYTVTADGHHVFYLPHPEDSRGGHLRFEEWFPIDYYQMAILNVSEELDAKGEYFIDPATMTFYVYDPSGDYNFTGGEDVMLRLGGADCLRLTGLTFKNARVGMIYTYGSTDVTVDGCLFVGCGGEIMANFGFAKDITVRNTEFRYAAQTALDVYGSKEDVRFYEDTGIRIENNLFTRTGLVVGNSAALGISRTSGTQIRNNEFRDCCWEGVNFRGACNMTAEYNVFDRVCCNGDDTGALNNWASFNMCGNVIRYNLFVNVTGGTNGRFCAYLDNTAGTEMYSNIFFNCDCPQMNHDICKYNSYHDNAEVLSGGIVYNTYLMELVDEAVESGDLSEIENHEFYITWKNNLDYFESKPWLKEILSGMWPGYFDISTDLSDVGNGSFCLNNSLTVTGNRNINKSGKATVFNELISRYSTIEDNVAYTMDENPLFVNPTLGDYRIREGADFPDIRFEMMGRY